MSGNMFESDLVKPINKSQLQQIVANLEFKLGSFHMLTNPSIRHRTLGSSAMSLNGELGRKDLMGDIDIAISYSSGDPAIDLATIEEYLKKAFPSMEVRSRASLKIVSLLYKLAEDHFVQIDFILGDLDVLKFMFTSPDPSHFTNYKKGFYRNFYISALTQMLRNVQYEDGEPVAFAGPKLDRHKGITFEYRHHAKRKNGNGRVKQITKISKDEFNSLYGTDINLPETVLSSPVDIINHFFPNSTQPSSFYDTVENFRLAVAENYDLTLLEKIEKRFNEIIESN